MIFDTLVDSKSDQLTKSAPLYNILIYPISEWWTK